MSKKKKKEPKYKYAVMTTGKCCLKAGIVLGYASGDTEDDAWQGLSKGYGWTVEKLKSVWKLEKIENGT